jgi:catecholate siderophore receptor
LRQTAATITALIMAQGLATGARASADDMMAAENETPTELPKIQVEADRPKEPSSPKFTEPLRDTPQTLVVIPKAVFESQGATTLSDVLRNTPGITFFAGEGGSANRTGGDSFYLRGFDTSNSIFIDGVRDEGAVTRDIFNVEQVEVVKGPSAENGRGGTAGYINLETKVPTLEAFQAGTVSYGFDDSGADSSERATLDINQPLQNKAIRGAAFRLNLMGQNGGVPGRDIAEKNRWSFAPSLALGLGTPTQFTLAYQHTRENNLPDYGLPSSVVASLLPPAYASLYSPGVNPANYYGFANFDYEYIGSDAITARLTHEFSPTLKVSNQTRYSNTNRLIEATSPSSTATTPAGEATLSQGIYQTRNNIISNQTNVTADLSTGAVHHALTTGLELSREDSGNPIWAVVPLGVANPSYLVSIYQPNDYPAALLNYAPHQTGTLTDTQIDTGALYAFDTVKFNKFWQLIGGLRLEHYDIQELSITTAAPAIAATPALNATATTPATAATAAVAAVPASTVNLEAAKTTLSWKTGLVYSPADNGSFYVSYNTSVRPPGTSGVTNTLSTTVTSADNPLLEPQKAINYEVGSKWDFINHQLLATVALFRSVNSNVPATNPVTGLVDQTSDQTVQGIEFGLSGQVTEKWLIFAGYSRMESKVSSLISTNAQGLTLPLLPKESGNLWTTYQLPFKLTLGGGVQYMGETQRLQATSAPVATTFSGQVPSYWLLSGMISYEFNRHFTLRLNATNLADRTYIASLNNNGYRVNLGAPRAFVLTGEFKF